MSSPVDEQLNWLAIQYVLGELSDAERAAFEVRLMDDPAACEAVTVASRMVMTARVAFQQANPIVGAKHSSPMSKPVAPAPRGSWLALAGAMVAACLVLGLVGLLIQDQAPSPANSTAELVSLWRTGVSTTDTEAEEADSEADAANDDSVPTWMLAALSFEKDSSIDGSSDKPQEN